MASKVSYSSGCGRIRNTKQEFRSNSFQYMIFGETDPEHFAGMDGRERIHFTGPDCFNQNSSFFAKYSFVIAYSFRTFDFQKNFLKRTGENALQNFSATEHRNFTIRIERFRL